VSRRISLFLPAGVLSVRSLTNFAIIDNLTPSPLSSPAGVGETGVLEADSAAVGAVDGGDAAHGVVVVGRGAGFRVGD
jgi:hypothetical protein